MKRDVSYMEKEVTSNIPSDDMLFFDIYAEKN